MKASTVTVDAFTYVPGSGFKRFTFINSFSAHNNRWGRYYYWPQFIGMKLKPREKEYFLVRSPAGE